MANLNIKIDVTKILKEHLFQGKNGAKYLDITLWENREGTDQYGNTHMAVQSLPKELRDQGQKGPILGNAKEFGQPGRDRTAASATQQRNNQGGAPSSYDDETDIPFSPYNPPLGF